jgi:hypothetical protein
MLPRQVIYPQSQVPIPICYTYFSHRVLCFCPERPQPTILLGIPTSVACITGAHIQWQLVDEILGWGGRWLANIFALVGLKWLSSRSTPVW